MPRGDRTLRLFMYIDPDISWPHPFPSGLVKSADCPDGFVDHVPEARHLGEKSHPPCNDVACDYKHVEFLQPAQTQPTQHAVFD